jgi:hypothetical protein
MNLNVDRLKSFLGQLRTISLWDRVFHWTKFRNQLIDAAADIQQLDAYVEYSRDLYLEIRELQNKEENRRTEHLSNMATLENIRRQISQEREIEKKEKNELELERIRKLKDTWSHHEEQVRNTVRSICSKNNIEYVDKVPFKGEPDNTVKICNEYVIFDAKSPGGEDLRNFPGYLRDQAEKARKYIKEDGVRKEIFLTIPANALGVVSTYVYRLPDYTVYIISQDALEPLILSLQRLEDYEFAGQLSPEERDNICRVIGKFAHLTKRRIQIDNFFSRQFMELAYKSENDLPADILEKSLEFEKAEKLNPPTERRSKQINMKELEQETIRLGNETAARGIPPVEEAMAEEINKMPLYEK